MQLLPKWYLHNNRPSFYDTDSVTILELAAKLSGAMNELIAEYNKHSENIDKLVQDFINDANADRQVFETALRQEFQDFIDVINMKYDAQEARIDAKIAEANAAMDALIARLNAAEEELLNAEY